MMIVEIDSPTFPLTTFIIREKSRKMKVSQSPLEELQKRPGLGERDSSKIVSLRTADVFPVVASEGEKRRPEIRLLFAC